MSRVPTVLQTADTDCGPACLTAIVRHYGGRVTLAEVRAVVDPGRDGASALIIAQTAEEYGVRTRAILTEPADLAARVDELPLPLVAHLTRQHYIVVERVTSRGIDVMDPAVGRRRMSRDELGQSASGMLLLTSRGPSTLTGRASAPDNHSRDVLTGVLRRGRSILAGAGALSALLAVLGLTLPLATALIVDSIVGSQLRPAIWLAVAAAVAGVVGVLTWLRARTLAALQFRLATDLSSEVTAALFSRRLRFFDRRSVGDLYGRVASAHSIHTLLGVALLGAGLDTILTIGYLVALTVLAPLVALAAGVVAVVMLAISVTIARVSARLRRREILAQATEATALVDGIEGIATVRAYGAEQSMLDRWALALNDRLLLGRSRERVSAVSAATIAASAVAAPLLILVVAASSAATPGHALGLMALGTAALAPLSSLAGQLIAIADLRPMLDRVGDLLSAEAERVGGIDPGRLSGEITLQEVGFGYDRRSGLVLRGLTAHIPAGSKIGVVGATGCGKSTLAALITGLYSPTSGSITLDGQDLERLDLAAVRSQVAVVHQDNWLGTATLREAILAGRPGYTDNDIWRALQTASVAHEVAALPLGLQTRLGAGGRGLSAGQRQRIALARALLGRPAILILDEATSALDARTEAEIEAELAALPMTRIVIAHRLSTVADADSIWVIDDGEIIEQGSPERLAAAASVYSRMLAAASYS